MTRGNFFGELSGKKKILMSAAVVDVNMIYECYKGCRI